MYYAAQFRDMHTAIHNLLIYTDRVAAFTALGICRTTEGHPSAYGLPPVDQIEINFRHPPTEHKGEPLEIVNSTQGIACGVPDVWPGAEA